jgi:tight junction protein 1
LPGTNALAYFGVVLATAKKNSKPLLQTVSLVVKRRVVLPPTVPATTLNGVPASTETKSVRVTLSRNKKKEDFGVVLGCKIYIKEITGRTVADKVSIL